ncbi:hypothetical protein Q671_15785 [Halomonas sp. PBN3]|nr:hypothetical protein Q671_15785 [Halomonas sp. PBN3]
MILQLEGGTLKGEKTFLSIIAELLKLMVSR